MDAFKIYSNTAHFPRVSTHPRCDGKCVEKAVEGSMKVPHDTSGVWGGALNTPLFIQVWRHIFQTGTYRAYKWTVKTETDVVFVSSRLRAYLRMFPSETPVVANNIANNNRRPGAWEPAASLDFTTMWGGIEVFSRGAVQAYEASPDTCEGGDWWRLMGEDGYVEQCMKRRLRVGQIAMPGLHFNWANVGSCGGPQVTYHKFKTVGEWTACFEKARRSDPKAFERMLGYVVENYNQ